MSLCPCFYVQGLFLLVHGEFTPCLTFGVNAWHKAGLVEWMLCSFQSAAVGVQVTLQSPPSHLLQTGKASSGSLPSLDFHAVLSFSTLIALASNARTNSGFLLVTREDSAFFDYLNLNFLAPDCTYWVYCPLWQPPASPGLLALYLRVSKIVLNHVLIVSLLPEFHSLLLSGNKYNFITNLSIDYTYSSPG